jgi:hypothetical protein
VRRFLPQLGRTVSSLSRELGHQTMFPVQGHLVVVIALVRQESAGSWSHFPPSAPGGGSSIPCLSCSMGSRMVRYGIGGQSILVEFRLLRGECLIGEWRGPGTW